MIKHVTLPDSTQIWYKGDYRHREDGPAVIRYDGTQAWFRNGKIHREDGPAVIYADGTQEWWVNGKKVDPLVVFVLHDSD